MSQIPASVSSQITHIQRLVVLSEGGLNIKNMFLYQTLKQMSFHSQPVPKQPVGGRGWDGGRSGGGGWGGGSEAVLCTCIVVDKTLFSKTLTCI